MTATHEALIAQLNAYRTHTALGTKKADALSAKLSSIRLKLAEDNSPKPTSIAQYDPHKTQLGTKTARQPVGRFVYLSCLIHYERDKLQRALTCLQLIPSKILFSPFRLLDRTATTRVGFVFNTMGDPEYPPATGPET